MPAEDADSPADEGSLSGSEQRLKPTVLKAGVDDATRIAGKLSFDDTSAGGPKVEADFDATILEAFTVAR